MPYCKKCGSELEPDALFCPECGAPVSKSKPSSKKHVETPPQNSGQTIQRKGIVYGVPGRQR